MIKSILLQNFRNHGTTHLECGPYTMMLGANGAGKSGVLYGICYALTGACSITQADGKGADAMIRAGAESLNVRIDFDGWDVGRGRSAKQHVLAISGVDGVKPEANQAILLQKLGVPRETLLALLDPKPLLEREPAMQREILLRALGPPEIQATVILKAAGISKINGIEHLDKLHSEIKAGPLRDANREKKRREAIETAKPKWPFEGWTEEQISENLRKAKAERDTISADVGRLEQRLAATKEQTAGPSGDPQALRKEIEETKEMLASADTAVEDAEANLADVKARIKSAEANIAALNNRRPLAGAVVPLEPHCPTCKCDIKALAARIEEEQTTIRQTVEGEQGSIEAFRKQMAGLTAEVNGTRDRSGRLSNKLREVESSLKAYEIAAKKAGKRETVDVDVIEAELGGKRAMLEAANAKVEHGTDCQTKIAVWKEQGKAAEQHAKDYMALIAPDGKIAKLEAAVKELERIKERVVQDGIGPFLADMQAFLQRFGFPPLAFDAEEFTVAGRPAWMLSAGQAQMFFEAAFRVAVAKRVKFPLVVLDHASPVSENHVSALLAGLRDSGCQAIVAWTTSKKPEKKVEGVSRYWLSEENGVCKAEAI